MSPERWHRLNEIWQAALQVEPGRRADFVRDACAGDNELRAEIESLLACEDKAGSFLEPPGAQQQAGVLDSGLTGRTVAHYQILEKLGEGGMGAVYKAHDTHLDRPVALKVLPPGHLADPERKQRLLREARAASALNHPNIITVHDIASDRGVDFIAMEFVEGRSLDRIIPAEGLPLETALDYAGQIAAGLAKAHAAGIIHRDLKPSNIMVTGDGLAKLLDFGLARRVRLEEAQKATLTAEGEILGTACYMSPEQAQGKRADARSDIFSFGVVLYEMLSGRRAFRGDSVFEILESVVHEEPVPLAGLPPELEKLVARCLRKNPARRFQHMDDVRLVLEELKEECESGRLARGARTRPAPAKRKRVLLGAAALAVLAGAILAWYLLRPGARPEAEAVPLTSYPGSELEPSFSPDGNQVAFSWNGEKEDNWDIYVKRIGPGQPLRLTTHPGEDFSPAFSPDGHWVAFRRRLAPEKGAVLLAPALGGPERKLAETHLPPEGWLGKSGLAWSPDGNWLAVPDRISPEKSRPRALFLLSVETGEKRQLTSPPTTWIGDRHPAFSPDGRRLAFTRSRGPGVPHVYTLTLTHELAPEEPPKQLTSGSGPVWVPGGREIIFSYGESLWRIAASGAGGPQRLAQVGQHPFYPHYAAIASQGRRLVYARPIIDINIWRIEAPVAGGKAGRPLRLIASTRNDSGPRYSPDGRRIALVSSRSGSWGIWVCDSDGLNCRQLTDGVEGFSNWSPDGEYIVFDGTAAGQRDIYVIRAEGGKPRRLTTDPADHVLPGWSRDGKWIYFSWNRTGEHQVWKMPAGPPFQPEKAVQVTKQGGSTAFESPDRKFLYYAKHEGPTSLWKVPVAGGEETQVLESVGYLNFAIVNEGIYFRKGMPDPSIHFYDFATGAVRLVAEMEKPGHSGLTVSPDGRWILYSQFDHESDDLMLVENFR